MVIKKQVIKINKTKLLMVGSDLLEVPVAPGLPGCPES